MVATRINSDFKDIIRAFSSEAVRYLVVGGIAVIEHTEPRYTKDLDLWVEPSKENASRTYQALRRFGAPLANLKVADLMNEDLVYQLGIEPIRIDLLMGMAALEFEACWSRKVVTRWGHQPVNLLSLKDLVTNKRRVGRPQDLADVDRLLPLLRKKR
jgi:hypothetical protein